jgi:hypothetical protein
VGEGCQCVFKGLVFMAEAVLVTIMVNDFTKSIMVANSAA